MRRPAEVTCEAKAVLVKVWVRPQQPTVRPFREAAVSSGVQGARTFRVMPSREPSHGNGPGHLSSSVRVAKRTPSRLMKVARKSQQPEGISLVSKQTSSRPIPRMTRRCRSSPDRWLKRTSSTRPPAARWVSPSRCTRAWTFRYSYRV